MTETPARSHRGIAKSLKHPLFLLFIGALVTGWGVPYLSSKIGREQTLRENRMKESIEILDHNALADAQVNALRTTLEDFYKDINPNETERRKEARELKKQMNALYAVFDGHAWYWCKHFGFEARILQMPQSAQAQIFQYCASYSSNLVQTVHTINPIWRRLVQCHPATDEASQIEAAHRKLDELTAERDEIVSHMLNLFAF
jgi:hypothetical protein